MRDLCVVVADVGELVKAKTGNASKAILGARGRIENSLFTARKDLESARQCAMLRRSAKLVHLCSTNINQSSYTILRTIRSHNFLSLSLLELEFYTASAIAWSGPPKWLGSSDNSFRIKFSRRVTAAWSYVRRTIDSFAEKL